MCAPPGAHHHQVARRFHKIGLNGVVDAGAAARGGKGLIFYRYGYIFNAVRMPLGVPAGRGVGDTPNGKCIQCGGRVEQAALFIEQIMGIGIAWIGGKFTLPQVAGGYDKEYAQFPAEAVKGIGQPAQVATIVNLVAVAVAEIEYPATILLVQINDCGLDSILNKFRLIVSVVFKHLAGEKPQHGRETASLKVLGHILIQGDARHEGAMPVGWLIRAVTAGFQVALGVAHCWTQKGMRAGNAGIEHANGGRAIPG